ncbi:MAG TPA: hypothetical protein VMV18_05775, partial [bacterium]|nr:hypothetical protein [bacterium]
MDPVVSDELPRDLVDAASTLRFALASAGEGRHRLVLADTHVGVKPFAGVRVDALEIDLPGTLTAAEVAAGPSALKNRRGDLRRLRFSIEESAVERLLRDALAGTGLSSVALRFFGDHVRVYVELPAETPGLSAIARAVLCASVDVDEAGNFILSFYDVRVFGRLPPGMVPSALLDRLVPGALSRQVTRGGATRVVLKPYSLLLTSWLPAAGWKVPDVSRATDRHFALRGDRLYVELSQTASPGLVAESTTARNLSAFEYAEAERLFEDGEKKLAAGDLAGAAAVYRPHADPDTGHPFALRRLAWILTAQADGSPAGRANLAEARALAAGIARRFPEDPVAPETLATLAIAEGNRVAAVEAYEALAARTADENDLKGRVFAELLLGELYALPGEGQDLPLARTSWETALSLDPDSLYAQEHLAEVYARIGEHAKAIHAWWKVLDFRTEVAARKALLLRIAETHLEGLKDPEAAVAVYRQAQEGDDPENPTVAAWEGLARAYAAKGDAPAAIRQLERVAERCLAVKDITGAARANFSIGELWAGPLKRPESALLRYSRALELDPKHPGALARRLAMQKERKAYPEALVTGATLAEVLPPAEALPLWLELAGIADRETKDFKAAARFAASAFRVDPANAAAREAVERLHPAAGDLAGLAALYESVLPRVSPKLAFELRARRAQLFAGAL